MKRFKDLLNEFRNAFGNNHNSGGDGGDFHKYARKKIKEFMEKTPFNYRTPERHELHFHDSLNAARTIAVAAGIHYAGLQRSIINPKHATMTNYFVKSTETHDDILDAIQKHIMEHPNLPDTLRAHVPSVIAQIESEHSAKSLEKAGNYAIQQHLPPVNAVRHPHLTDTAHHLKGVIEILKDNPDQGYFLRREEQM
jgi:hypothetical protein